jgi:hypothetical protein
VIFKARSLAAEPHVTVHRSDAFQAGLEV